MSGSGLQVDLEWTRQVLSFVLEDEARRTPEAAAALRDLANKPGKLLRPRLVLGVSRFVLGETAVPEADFRGASLELQRLSERLGNTPARILRNGAADLESWVTRRSFEGALENRFYLLAVALEILHLATLTHDDVVDGAEYRRGLPSARSRLGNSGAVLLGDLLLTLCFSLVNEAASRETARLLSGLVRLMARAEFLQLGLRKNLWAAIQRPNRRDCLRILGGKTALLFGLAMVSGAREAGAKQVVLEELGRSGYALGMAFQIADDIGDFLVDPRRSGKPRGQDLREGQITLPVIEAVRHADEVRRYELARLIEEYTSGSDGVLDIIVEQLEHMGGFRSACELALTYLSRARRHLNAAHERGGYGRVASDLSALIDQVEESLRIQPENSTA